MAIPLKNGADLYNFEVLRMRFHNLGADPTSDFGVGQVYFNTSTSEGSGKRVRIYDGSAFRSLAYFDEIDNRLKLLEGEIDTDAIISNMKEVSAFLAGFEEDASLMNVLNGKLDKTGGTISGQIGSLKILRTNQYGSSITFQNTKDGVIQNLGGLGFDDAGNASAFSADYSKAYTLMHSGNIGSQIVEGITTHTGDATNANGDIAKLNSYYSSKGFRISRFNGLNGLTKNPDGLIVNWPLDGSYGQQWYIDDESHTIQTRYVSGGTWSAWKTIAFTDSNVASATKLETPRTIWGQSFDGTGGVSGNLTLGYATIKGASNESAIEVNAASLNIGYGYRTTGKITTIYGDSVRMAKDGAYTMFINSSGNVTIGSSDLAGTDAKLYVEGSGTTKSTAISIKVDKASVISRATYAINPSLSVGKSYGIGHLFGADASANNMGNIVFRNAGGNGSANNFVGIGLYGNDNILNVLGSGNVLIGTTTDDESGAKLQVEGPLRVYEATQRRLYTRLQSSALQIGRISSKYTGGYYGGITVGEDGTTSAYVAGIYDSKADNKKQFFYGGKSVEDSAILINGVSGNVGIGKVSPTEKLHVVGNLLVEGNIIATGEVSAGGAGEEGDTGTGTGGGDALIYSQEFTPTTTSITITHNLSATKGVIVQVWEKNGNYWDMVLVDVEEVDTNTVTLFFGKTETTVHKVVIMG